MRLVTLLAVCGSLVLAGCGGDSNETTSNDPASDPALANRSTPEGGSGVVASSQTPQNDGGFRILPLSPENATIQFVGTHITEDGGPDPNARVGVFTEFSGEAGINPETDEISSVSVVIQTASAQTPEGGLNGHLQRADFFNVREYPTATFESTQISPATGDSATHTVTGNFKLLETTKEISFPAVIQVGEGNVNLDATFVLDRTEYGMNYGLDRVNKEVAMTVSIGKKTEPPQSGGGFGGGGGRGRGGRGFDPAAMFGRFDADSDGKLAGDEIPDRMRENLENIDTDGNGEVTLEEFQESMARFGGRRGGNDQPSDGE